MTLFAVNIPNATLEIFDLFSGTPRVVCTLLVGDEPRDIVFADTPGFDPSAKDASLPTPLDMAVSSDGKTLYLAAYGSSRIGVFDTAALENGSFDPRISSANYISLSGGGPAGIVFDEARSQLYVVTRFDNSVKAIDLTSRHEIVAIAITNPEPTSVINGRPMLYDATRFSGKLTDADLRKLAAAPDQEITYTATTPGAGMRMAFGRWLKPYDAQVFVLDPTALLMRLNQQRASLRAL